MLFIYFLIEIDFLYMRSYFLPANQNMHLKTHNQSKFICDGTTMFTYSEHTYWPMRECILP